jgi:ribonuclease E
LQILRIIQEESMKDNTAAVHAQVPVEVASFLLNEKRPEIAKIELKQRINVMLVPNKSLETPHYKLERLKHDDPRLDNIEASYTMAEVVEDPTTVTRRSQEPTNRQTPVIKGVLPDAPAPASLPKAESTKPAPSKSSQAAAKTESSGGFFAWLKGLFGGTTETKEEPAKNVGKRGERTAKDGERTDRGDRNGDRRGGRGGRGGRRGERNDRGERTEGATERNENTETRAPRENGGNRRGAERSDRNGQRGERAERGERRENANPNGNNAADTQNVNAEVTDSSQADTRNEARAERAPRGEGRRERGDGRRERGDRGGDRRNNDNARPNNTSENTENLGPAQAELNYNNDSQANGASDTAAQGEERQDAANGTPERRERRSRDRYGRDRRERNTNIDGNTSENLQTDQASQEVPAQEEAPVARSYFDRAASTAAPAESTSKAEPPVASPAPVAVAAPAPSAAPSTGLPKVQAYELPMASLVQVAEGSGLQWVNSDPEKIAQVQADIAAEPKPVHVPRVRPPVVVVDEGPLVLVETRKDLSDMKLPF